MYDAPECNVTDQKWSHTHCVGCRQAKPSGKPHLNNLVEDRCRYERAKTGFSQKRFVILKKNKKLYESEWPTFLRLLASQRRLTHLRGEERRGGEPRNCLVPPYGHVSKCQFSPRQRWRRSCPSWATPSKVCRRCPCGSSTTGNTRGPSSACGSTSWRKVSRLG